MQIKLSQIWFIEHHILSHFDIAGGTALFEKIDIG